MLQLIRERAQGIIAWVIVILILIPFALWGINDYMGGGREAPLAEVNGAEISKIEFQNAYLQQRQQLEQMLGPNFRPDMFPEAPMKQAILQRMVEQKLVAQAARDAGLRMSDDAVASLIRSVEAFQDGSGQFSQASYERALRTQGMTPAGFEAKLRNDMASEQWRIALQQTAFATAPEMDRYLRLQNQTRDLGYVNFSVETFAAKAEVSDAEVQQYYEENKARFTEPEMVRVAYLELSATGLGANIEVSDDQVRGYYEAHVDEFSEPENRRASHILFRVEPDAPAEAEQAARKKAEEALSQIRAGQSFTELAKKLSQDPGSAAKGGDLGFFGRGSMVPEFESKVFGMKKGEVSDPVRSPFGYHLIRLEDVRGGAAKPFEQVRDQIRARLREEKASERFYDVAEQLGNLTYEHPDTLQVAARELKLPIKQTGYFSRQGGAGPASNPKFVQAAFHEDVLEGGNNSETVELARDQLVVLRVEDRRPEAQRPLQDVKPQIVSQLRRQKAADAARQAAEQALEAIRNGADPVSVAKKAGATWSVEKAVGRTNTKLPRPVVETAFRMPRPAADARSAERTELPSGDQAVVVVQSVQEGAGAAPADKPQEKAQAIVRADADSAYQGVVSTLKQQGEIKIRQDQL